MHTFKNWLEGFIPDSVSVNQLERLRACTGALMGILLTGLVTQWRFGDGAQLPILIAPMGASAVLLFALPASPLAQPWSIIGGNLVSAAVGVSCAKFVGNPISAATLAIFFSIGAMFALRCLHPPSGAVALTAVLGGPTIHSLGYHFLLAPVGINSLLMVAVALLFNNLTQHRYPNAGKPRLNNAHKTADPFPLERLGFTSTDLDYVLQRYNQTLDVSRDALENLMIQTELHAYRRRFGEIICSDIMSRDVVTVQSDTMSAQAWKILMEHSLKALPVIDANRRVCGIVTMSDFLKHAGINEYVSLNTRLKNLLHTARKPQFDQRVSQIMTHKVHTVTDSMHIAQLVPLMADLGLHHIPVINGDQHLVGIISNTDLVASLYHGRLADGELRN